MKTAIAIAAATLVALPTAAMAESYVGAGIAINSAGVVEETFFGRYSFEEAPISIRAQVTDLEDAEASLSVTGDLGGAYAGAGVATRLGDSSYFLTQEDETVAFLQLGYEYQAAQNLTLVADVKTPFSTDDYVFTFGGAYSF